MMDVQKGVPTDRDARQHREILMSDSDDLTEDTLAIQFINGGL